MNTATKSNSDFLQNLDELLKDSIPKDVLVEIGKACILDKKDLQVIMTNLLSKDISPLVDNAKVKASKIKDFGIESKNYFDKLKNVGESSGVVGVFQSLKEDSVKLADQTKNAVVETFVNAKTIIPEARSRIIKFCDSIVKDYNSLESEEEKGRYILKMTIFLSIFAMALNAGNELPDSDFSIWGAGAHRSFLSHSVLPMILVSAATTILLRTIEQAETKLENNKEALHWTNNIKTILNLTRIGFGAGLTFHLFVDGLVQTGGTIRIHDLSGNVIGSLVPNTRVDDMVYTTLMALLSNELTTDHKPKD